MNRKKVYRAPAVLQRVPLALESDVLGGSVADSLSGNVESTGQKVENKDFSSTGSFNHSWED